MFRLLLLTAVSIVFIYAVQGAVVDKFVRGKITHVGPNTIEKNSQVKIELQDTSLIDAGAKVIGTTIISDAKSFPISYNVKYNPSVIIPGHIYSMSARITGSDGSLRYINDMHTPAGVSGSTASMVDIAVIRIGGGSSIAPAKPNGQKTCAPVNCRGKPKVCPYGYRKKDSCEICMCNDPCNPSGKPILCGPKQRCFVEKKSDGTFGTRCDVVSSKPDKDAIKGSKAVCREPKVVGLCMAALQRFHYNSATKHCESFIYGGCGANGNNFPTKAACEKLCKAA